MRQVDRLLLRSANNGDLAGVQRAIDSGADINVHDTTISGRRDTALMYASKKGHTETVRLLLDHGANPNSQDKYGDTPLILAVAYGDMSEESTDILRLLLDHGADVNVQDNDGNTALMTAMTEERGAEIVKLLLDHGADPNVHEDGDTTPLIYATWIDNEIVRLLLVDHGADPNAQDADGKTALIHVCKGWGADAEVVKLLFDHGADVNAQDNDGYTALMNASHKGHTETVRFLLEHGADVNLKNKKGDTALIRASEEGHTEIVRLLLDHGADVNAQDKDGNTALIHASRDGHTEIVRLLLDHGADPLIENNKGELPQIPDKLFAKYLLQHPIDAPNKGLENIQKASHSELVRLMDERDVLKSQLAEAVRQGDHAKANRLRRQVAGTSQIKLPSWIQTKITNYLFQDLQSLTVSQLRRVYQKVYGKKCLAKTKREILKLLHRK